LLKSVVIAVAVATALFSSAAHARSHVMPRRHAASYASYTHAHYAHAHYVPARYSYAHARYAATRYSYAHARYAATRYSYAHARYAPARYSYARARYTPARYSYAPARYTPALYSYAPAGGGSVLAEATRWIGSGNMTGKAGPWCADAVSFWLRRTGHRPLANRMVASVLSYGPRLAGPRVGALAVIRTRRGWAGHVGVVEGVEPNGSIRLVSGNWGHRVAQSIIARNSVMAYVAVP
jgi:uncharacterized protein (TIGR02594 family)